MMGVGILCGGEPLGEGSVLMVRLDVPTFFFVVFVVSLSLRTLSLALPLPTPLLPAPPPARAARNLLQGLFVTFVGVCWWPVVGAPA
jgi:hypothetical protein